MVRILFVPFGSLAKGYLLLTPFFLSPQQGRGPCRKRDTMRDRPPSCDTMRDTMPGLSAPLRIVLIDGDQLAKLMLRYNVGCRVEETLEIKKIDEDFFE